MLEVRTKIASSICTPDLKPNRTELIASEVLNVFQQGIITTQRDRTVLWMNQQARKTLDLDGDLIILNQQLRCRESKKDSQLKQLINTATAVLRKTNDLPRDGGLVLRLANGSSLLLTVKRVPVSQSVKVENAEPSSFAAVFVTEPDQCTKISPELLSDLYGLTRKEACIASELVTGGTIDQAGKASGIRGSTARWHLKRILEKTGAHRQPELIRIILSGPGATFTKSQ